MGYASGQVIFIEFNLAKIPLGAAAVLIFTSYMYIIITLIEKGLGGLVFIYSARKD
jgi:hypothetical protein